MDDALLIAQILDLLGSHSYSGSALEQLLGECVKVSRERRYFGRSYGYRHEWRPVLREGYGQYVVSNWGCVRIAAKSAERILRPSLEHEYARAPMSAAHRKGGSQHMIHELVIESFILGYPIPKELRETKKVGDKIINHLDGDKWHPALHNLEITDQCQNMAHAYATGLRQPRKSYGT